jgi:hypothetical protein
MPLYGEWRIRLPALSIPASGLQAAVFAKPASMPVYPAKPFGFLRAAKTVRILHSPLLFNTVTFSGLKIKKQHTIKYAAYGEWRIRTFEG